MIPAGAVLTIRFTGQGGTGYTVDQLASDLADHLAQDAPSLTVLSSQFDTPNVIDSVLSGQIFHYVYAAVLVVKTSRDTDSLDAVVGQVLDDVTNITGYRPSASSGDYGGTPDTTLPQTGVFGPIATVANALHADVQVVLFGGLAIAALIVVLIAFGPNIPKLAKVSL
jgi:hypothetical protein